jgi:hypothetical protein
VLGSAGPSAARHSETDADGRRAVGHARLARSPVAVSRPRPSPAGVPARCGSRRCAVYEKYMEGVSAVDGRWMGVAMPGMCPGVLGPSARIRLGGPCPGVLAGSEPRIQGFCLRVWRFSGPCGGLYVAVRGIGDAGARAHVHIDDSAPGVSIVQCRLRMSGAVWRCRQERTVNRSLCRLASVGRGKDVRQHAEARRPRGRGYAARGECE